MELGTLKQNIWSNLATTSNDNTVNYEPIISYGSAPYFACIFVSADKSFNLIISLSPSEKEKLINIYVIGLKISYLTNWLVVGRERQTYIHLRCEKDHHSDSFTKLIKEILILIFIDMVLPNRAVNSVVRKWKSFWKNQSVRVLPENEIIGLMAELAVLRSLLAKDPEKALDSWRGPDHHKYDFVIHNHMLEVKTTIRGSHIHIINGLDQLESDEDDELLVASLLAEKLHEGRSLNSYIDEIMQYLYSLPDLCDKFVHILSGSGYSPEHSENYDKIRIVFRDARVFPINEDTPKLTKSCLSNHLSARISEIRYTLDFEGLPSEQMNETFFDYLCESWK